MRIFSKRRPQGRPAHPDVLTPAEWRVLEQVRAGRTNQEIADHLGVSHNTVKTHVANILAKLDVQHRHELAAWRGAPADASRTALGRLSLATPWLGRAAALGGAVVAGAIFLVAMQAMDESGSSTGASTVTPTPTDEPREASPVALIGDPGRFPTGLSAVDETVTNVIDGDVEALVARIAYEERVCASNDSPSDAPLCEALGVPAGSMVTGLRWTDGGRPQWLGGDECTPELAPAPAVPSAVGTLLDFTSDLQLWSVFEPTQRGATGASTLSLVFATVDPGRSEQAPQLQIEMQDDAIVGIVLPPCVEDIPAPDHVSRWVVHPTDLGHVVQPESPTPSSTATR